MNDYTTGAVVLFVLFIVVVLCIPLRTFLRGEQSAWVPGLFFHSLLAITRSCVRKSVQAAKRKT